MAVLGALAAAVLAAPGPAAGKGRGHDPWARLRRPSQGPSHAVGGYSDGCLEGAVRLPLTGHGFRVMLPARRRFFGHRVLAAFLRHLGAEISARHLGFLPLGDLSQARGGPAPDGHSSHQTGLDVNIWFAVDPHHHGAPRPRTMVARGGRHLLPAWTRRMARILRLAALDPRVERIFVHPVIKRALCRTARGDHHWLHKLRPWWGHDDHFHVRLACPAGDAGCVDQAPVPPGDGCDKLDRWFKPHDRRQKAAHKAYQSHVGAVPTLPVRCADLLH